MNDRLLKTWQVADLLGVSTETILRWTRQGKLRGFPISTRAMRYRPEDVDAFLEAHATAGAEPRGVSPAPRGARQPEVSPLVDSADGAGLSSRLSPVPLRPGAAQREEEEHGSR